MEKKINIKDIFSSYNYLTVNRRLAQEIGLESSITLTILFELSHLTETKNRIIPPGNKCEIFYLFCFDDLLQMTCLTPLAQEKAIEHLTQLNLIVFATVNKNKYFSFNYEKFNLNV